MEKFGKGALELSKDDMRENPDKPVLTLLDEDEIIGKFDIKTGDIIYEDDLADYDIRFVNEYLANNKENLLETWNDYVKGWK
jgi:hypothetical protein